jgi:hypothetical protein
MRTLWAVAGVVVATAAHAQQAELQIGDGPHYAGETVQLRIVAQGFDEEPLPKLQVEPPPGGRLVLAGVSPNVSQSITIVNGQVSRTREVSHVFDLRFEADTPGRYRIGPIHIAQGAAGLTLATVDLELRTLPTRDDIAVELDLPDRPVYVGERVPVTIRFRLSASLQESLASYALRVPLFEPSARYRFVDAEPTGGSASQLQVTTASGPIALEMQVRELSASGEAVREFSAQRTLVPLAEGEFEVPPSTLLVNEGVGFRRSIFGERRATRVKPWRASDRPRTLRVTPVPSEGRPASFAGAVGRGFTLDARADRTVVRVGDPITLTLTLRGEGLDTAALPALDAEGLLPAASFRVPAGHLAGERVDDAKQFSAVVRVLDASVTEVPGLAFSWFDPEAGRFETTRSRPIALAVAEGSVIGASAVERAAREGPAGSTPSPEPARAVADSLASTGADLAIERDLSALSERVDASGMGALPAGLHVLSVGLVAWAWLDRRRRDEDPAVRERRRALAMARSQVREAGTRSGADILDVMADGLRRMRAAAPEVEASEIDALLVECDTRRFAPGDAGSHDALLERARAAAARFEELAR